MRPLALLVHPLALLFLQQAVSIWFLVEFFLARDSSTADNLRLEFGLQDEHNLKLKAHVETASDLKSKLCPKHQVIEPSFDKVIWVVIDALGSEFISSIRQSSKHDGDHQHQHSLPFVDQAIRQDRAIGYVAKAATPTVTMPRLKAMVSGTIPSFMDILHNLARDVSKFEDDNIIETAKAHGKRLVFYGDDTWLSLFSRNMFVRVKETFSFFASDYTTVDTNVTERALPEVQKKDIDWDYLILHYLGLDHIGHVYGSNKGPVIQEKLVEMDTVIKSLHDSMAAKKDIKTLMIITGDHGMSNEGNHGGDSSLEIDTAMIFLPINSDLNPRDKQHRTNSKIIQQIDLAVTLSLLTGMPIPRSSRGLAIKSLLESIWHKDQERIVCALMENMLQLAKLSDTQTNSLNASQTLNTLMKAHLTGDQDLATVSQRYHQFGSGIQSNMLETIASKSNPVVVLVAVALVSLLSLVSMRKASVRLLMPLMTSSERLICLVSLVVPIFLQNSTDFIESEHMFWPLYSMIVFIALSLSALRHRNLRLEDLSLFRVSLLIITFIICTCWNNLNLGKSGSGYILALISVLILCNFSRQTSAMKQSGLLFCLTGLFTVILKLHLEMDSKQQSDHTNLALVQAITMVWMVILAVVNIITSFKNGHTKPTTIVQKLATHWMWLAFLLARPHNFVYLIANLIMEASVNSVANSLKLSPLIRAIVYLQFATSAFYGQANTNLFTSIDVKPAFYGQTGYNFMLAMPLVACATFSSQIYWYIKLFQRVQGELEQERMSDGLSNVKMIPESTKRDVKIFLDMRNFLSLAYFMFVCVFLWNHLFIWSVVSPKLVYHYTSNTILQLVTLSMSVVPQVIQKVLMGALSSVFKDEILHVMD